MKSGAPWAAAALLVAGAGLPRAMASSAPATLALPNGLSATIESADYLRARLTNDFGAPAILLDDGRLVPVTTDINDPSIYNRGDGAFHPFSSESVEGALRAIEHPALPLAVRIYLLPYPRRDVLVSSTSGNEIFLSPHVLEIDPAVAGYIVAHELGHAFHNRFMPEGSAAWTEYRRLRGITDESRYSESAAHAYRPHEIFAEDFRVLFGGALASLDGRLENPELISPTAVGGLEEFYLRVAQSPAGVLAAHELVVKSYPNPFNPETEIRVSVPADRARGGATVSIRVYAVTGALVRRLETGPVSGDFSVRWDGRDDSGNRVASSTYYAAVEVGGERKILKLVLLK